MNLQAQGMTESMGEKFPRGIGLDRLVQSTIENLRIDQNLSDLLVGVIVQVFIKITYFYACAKPELKIFHLAEDACKQRGGFVGIIGDVGPGDIGMIST